MSDDLEFTGERFVPGVAGEIAHEHWHRYALARRFAAGKRVLDAACGEGYGSALLAGVAADVVGVDIAEETIAHARAAYAGCAGLRFEQAPATALPLPDASVDVVVSFETLEHLPRDDQPRMLAEFARVLTREGVLLLSAPNPVEYSDARGYRNPFHLHEPPREELARLVGVAFAAQRWYRQRRYFGSAVWSEEAKGATEVLAGDAARVDVATPPAAMYFIVLAAREEAALPAPGPRLSFFADRDDAELARIDARAGEVLRLDTLLHDRDAALDRQTAHVLHLEDLVAVRDRLVGERDAALASVAAERDALAAARAALEDAHRSELASVRQASGALQDECARLERALAAQERIIAYRQSARWWVVLPWLRLKLWWQRLRAT
jgi:SAM-dependent methyltransferase